MHNQWLISAYHNHWHNQHRNILQACKLFYFYKITRDQVFLWCTSKFSKLLPSEAFLEFTWTSWLLQLQMQYLALSILDRLNCQLSIDISSNPPNLYLLLCLIWSSPLLEEQEVCSQAFHIFIEDFLYISSDTRIILPLCILLLIQESDSTLKSNW